MKYYTEITFIMRDDFSFYQLWTKVYTQIHLALVETKNLDNTANVGISFPEYKFNQERGIGFLGTKIRLFTHNEESLQNLRIKTWLDGLSDYIHISSIRPVPQDQILSYAIFQRKQVKTNAERLARHRIKTRNDISIDDAIKLYQKRITKTNLPFIQLESLTSGTHFKMFIEKKVASKSNEFKFNTYGLSSKSTVPEF